ncbi:MAG: polyprenyl synthetase family protein [Dysgonamonadaceae bacterium]|jgi:geranylgeranyl diphosphate synthase type II|nr:polyprenyl synthetase family protein [Dysgonamonadaceae bacterium]
MITFSEAITYIERATQGIRYPEQPPMLYEPMAYLLSLKGKKVRPALALLSCNLFREKVDDAIPIALAWEIFHNFTLMHDDVMDRADIRRGQPSVHKKWNENTAILSGDAMLILAYKYLAKSPVRHQRELLDLFSATAAEICEGQAYDMLFESRLDVKEEEYLHMIRLKTAVMLGAALKSGAITGGAPEKDKDLLYAFGLNLGIAFQIQDDMLDVYGDPSVFGKKIGGDILSNKKTYLLVNALNTKEESEKATLLRWLQAGGHPQEEKIAAITALYDRLLLKEKAHGKMEYYYRKAVRQLAQVNVPAGRKDVLLNLAQKLMNRNS